MVINHLLTGMILQVNPANSRDTNIDFCEENSSNYHKFV